MPEAITEEQVATLFRKAYLGHEVKLDRIAAFARQEPDFDQAAEMASERAGLPPFDGPGSKLVDRRSLGDGGVSERR